MGRLLILGEEHRKATAHNAIHLMLKNNPNCLFLTEKRDDILVLRRALAKGERQNERGLLSDHDGNTAFQAIFDDDDLLDATNIHSVDFNGTNALAIINGIIDENGIINEFMLSQLMESVDDPEGIEATLSDADAEEYTVLTKANENLIRDYFADNVAIRELRNKYMAHNIIKFVENHPDKDIVVLCGMAHLCRTLKTMDAAANPTSLDADTRKSLLDFIFKAIPKNAIEVYIEDNPDRAPRYIPIAIEQQLTHLYKISPKKFSCDLPALIHEFGKNTEKGDHPKPGGQ